MKEAEDFLNGLTKKVRDKIFFNITKVMNGVKDKELFKKLDGSDDIWEFRTNIEKEVLRIKRRINYGNETDYTCRNARILSQTNSSMTDLSVYHLRKSTIRL